jgi:hypothetical protein
MRFPIRVFVLLLAAALCALAADPALLKLAMPDASVLVGIRLDQIKSSPLGQLAFSQVNVADAEFKKIVQMVGFDPLRDLHEVLIAVPSAPGKQRALVAVRGVFDPARLPTLAKLGGAQLTSYQGIEIATAKQEQQEFSVAALDPATLILGDPESVRGAIARRATGSRLSPKLLAKTDALSKAYDIWGVTIIPPGALAKGVPNPQLQGMLKSDALQSIQEASGGIRFGKDIRMALEVVTRTEKDAASLGDVFKFLAGLALTQGKPEQAKLLESLQVKVEGTTLKFALTIPEQQIAQMIEAQKKAMAAQRRRPAAKPAPGETAPVRTAPVQTGSQEITIYSSPKDMGVVKLPAPK